MAGLGRRTHYRKHLTDKVLYDFPIPASDECIAKVVATRGSNQFDILLACSNPSTGSRTPQLAILPTKFRKLVWVKRNDFVIVQTGDEEGSASESEERDGAKKDNGGIRYIINHILYKDQVKHLRSKGLWPDNDPEFSDDPRLLKEDENAGIVNQKLVADDGIVYEHGAYSDDDDIEGEIFVNTNRIANLAVQDSSSESDDED